MLCTLSNQQPQSSKRTIFTRKQMLPSKSSEATAAPFSLLTSKTSGLGSQSQLHQKSSSLDVEEGSLKSKVKYLWKTYGIIAIGTYFGIYVTTLSSIFVSLDFDVFNAASVGLDPVGAVQKARTLFVASFFFLILIFYFYFSSCCRSAIYSRPSREMVLFPITFVRILEVRPCLNACFYDLHNRCRSGNFRGSMGDDQVHGTYSIGVYFGHCSNDRKIFWQGSPVRIYQRTEA
jgi:hypothetical protein